MVFLSLSEACPRVAHSSSVRRTLGPYISHTEVTMESSDTPSVDEPPFRLVTVNEVADLLRLRPQTVYKMRSQGRLPAMRVGGRAVFLLSDFEELVRKEGRGLVGK